MKFPSHYMAASRGAAVGCLVLFLAAELTPQSACAQTNNPISTNIFFMEEMLVEGGDIVPFQQSVIDTRALLTEEDLQLKLESSLGDTLLWEPGVTSSSYGPGSSRPVIRGFSGYRVRVLQNGIGTGDISDTSPDHGVTIEPLLARKVEIIRGPATLLYGGSAIGGVVDVESKNIPKTPPSRWGEGAVSGRWDSVSNGRTAVLASTLGNESWAIQLNGLIRRAEDYMIPGQARLNAVTSGPNPSGELPSTWVATENLTLGTAKFWEKGRLGVSYSVFDSQYGVPFHNDAHNHLVGVIAPTSTSVSIDLRQQRIDIDADFYNPTESIEEITYRAGFSSYEHTELEGALIGTFFEKEEFDNRLQIDHAPVGDLFGGLGSSFTHTHFSSVGPEVNTPESFTRNFALFLIENYERERFRVQAGGRWEAQGVEVIGRRNARLKQSYHALSVSAGMEFDLTEKWKLSGNWSFAQRPPATAELFSNGPHLATGTFEIGGFYAIPGVPEGGGLDLEQSQNFELTLERTGSRVSGSFTYFQYDFDNYIFLSSLGPGWEINGLPIFRHVQREARFRGVEWETTFHLLPEDGDRHLDFTTMLDWVRADDLTAGDPLPRTPPLRIGGRLEYEEGPWHLGVELRRAAAMNRTQQTFETTTAGYTQLNADFRWTHRWGDGDRATSFFIKGSNLTDEEIRNHVSVIKDVAPLPGRNVTVGLTVNF